MTFWKKNKLKIIIPALIVLALAAAFVFGDRNMPKPKDTVSAADRCCSGGGTGAGRSGGIKYAGQS